MSTTAAGYDFLTCTICGKTYLRVAGHVCEPPPEIFRAPAAPLDEVSYWRARAERAEAAVAAEMPSIQEVNQLYEHILELKKREVKLEAALAAERAANRWIPVEERLPAKLGRYLFGMTSTVSNRFLATVEAYTPGDGVNPLYSHWRPILPPKEGEK